MAGLSEDLGPRAVDQVDLPPVPAGQRALGQPIAPLRLAGGGADHRNRRGVAEDPQIGVGRRMGSVHVSKLLCGFDR